MPYVRASPAVRRALERERHWVAVGATVLAAVAGYVNVVLLGFFHVPVSHMSGAVSRLGIDLAAADLADLKLVLSIVVGFLVGAALSGAIIGGTALIPGRRYGVVLLLEGLLLTLSMALLLNEHVGGVTLAAMACGVQNAMASSYYGLIIRTTHVTGIVTDLGVLIGHWLRHRRIQGWRLIMLGGILVGFFVGGGIGAFAVSMVGMWALAPPALGCAVAGLLYFAWQHRRRHLVKRSRARLRRAELERRRPSARSWL